MKNLLIVSSDRSITHHGVDLGDPSEGSMY
jgi:hypothetical protein